jgi:DNA-binding protein H-NS
MPTLEQIKATMKKLQLQADALIAKKAQVAVDQIRKLMLEHGLTTEDIEAKAKAKREGKAASGAAVSAKSSKVSGSLGSKVPPKYQHPKTGATWTGRGSAPAWIADVKDRTKYLIKNAADVAVSTAASAGSNAKTAVKKASTTDEHRGQRTGPQPAKYLDPKTGASWSGRGPAPAWLAAVKDRSKFLITGVAETSTASKASKPRSSAASGAVEKKAATKKVVAKKAVTKKVAAKKAVTAKAPAKKAIAKKAASAGKTAPAKKAPRKSPAVTAPATTVATGAESTS